jgi:LacI family transcriptional regulator
VRVTIRDVAREAGVSVATVSRVLNGSGPASADAEHRIREAAARLDYAPNEAARALIRSRTYTLGVLLPDLHGEFFSELIRGIDRSARHAGFHLLVSSFHSDPVEMERALRAMRGRVDGLLLMAPDLTTRAQLTEVSADRVVVLLNPPADDGALHDAVCVDNVGGARAMTRHLLALGRRRIAVITGDSRNHDAQARLRGYRDALRSARVARDPALEIAGDFSEASGYRATQTLLGVRPRPDAIFATNDAMAVGALLALRRAGLRVPHDIALAGFDDVPMARYLTPALTSVHVAIDELGRRATDLAVRAIEHGRGSDSGRTSDRHAAAKPRRRKPQLHVLPTTLVVRDSCGGQRDRDSTGAEDGAEDPAHAPGAKRRPASLTRRTQ